MSSEQSPRKRSRVVTSSMSESCTRSSSSASPRPSRRPMVRSTVPRTRSWNGVAARRSPRRIASRSCASSTERATSARPETGGSEAGAGAGEALRCAPLLAASQRRGARCFGTEDTMVRECSTRRAVPAGGRRVAGEESFRTGRSSRSRRPGRPARWSSPGSPGRRCRSPRRASRPRRRRRSKPSR